MKILAGVIWASTALQAYTVSAQALLYTSEPVEPLSKEGPPSISPNTARLLLAQRLGLSQYHSLDDANGATLHILNTFGGKQEQVFRDKEQVGGAEKLLLILDGVSNPKDLFNSSISPAVSIHPQPSAAQNLELALDFLEQDSYSRSAEGNAGSMQWIPSPSVHGGFSASGMGPDIYKTFSELLHHPYELQLHDYINFYNAVAAGSNGHTTILYVSSLQGLTPKDGERYTTALSVIKTFISNFHDPNSPISSTILIMPASPKTAKRSTTSAYGKYTKPLSARQQQQSEEPLSSPSTPSTHQPSSPELLQTSPSTTTTPLPRGIIPACHSSLDSAIAATNNCSGHGTAYQKSGGDIPCFACKCSKTVLTDDEGKVKTVYWGGPACQKKDISIPFFLLAGLSIALVAAVTWGIGLMASVGQEELPSVIGAGVSGPRAQK